MNIHGGNIYRAAEELGLNEREIIDFSASINPLGVPESVAAVIKDNIKSLCNYPDPKTKLLRQKIAEYYDIEPESIVCGNGSTELIYLIVRTLRPERALIPAPTFSEYERACETASYKLQVISCKLKKEDDFDVNSDEFISSLVTRHSSLPFNMAFLCNPNNPTGRLIKKDNIMKIAETAKALKCYLVVDEAFIDFMPEHSVIKKVENNPYLIVLRSMTKFYALSGIRLGYGVFPLNLIKKIKQYKEPWTVNTSAQIAGITALGDSEYKRQTFIIMAEEKRFMEEEFKRLGIDFIPSPVNYYLIRHDNAREIIACLKDKGILVRDCSNFKGLDNRYIRTAVKSRRDNLRLMEEISGCLMAL